MKLLQRLFLLSIISLTIFSCTSDDTDEPVTDGMLDISISNLPDVSTDYNFYAWLVGDNGVNLKLGQFIRSTDGSASATWTVGDLDFLASAARVLVTLEDKGNDPSTPSDLQLLDAEFGISGTHTGKFSTDPMRISVDDFSASTGLYFLATPTTSTMSEESSGIWFGDYNGGAPVGSLNLPTLENGWVYQGWAILNGAIMLETGSFTDPTMADLASPYSGPLDGFDVPGEDFNQNLPMMGTPPTLIGQEVVVTVQPAGMTTDYFPLEVFRTSIGSDIRNNYTLDNVFTDITGDVVRR